MRAKSETKSIDERRAPNGRAGRLATLGLVVTVLVTLTSVGMNVSAVGAAPDQALSVSGNMGLASMPAKTQSGPAFANGLPGSGEPGIVTPQGRFGQVRPGSVDQPGSVAQPEVSPNWSIEATPHVLKPQGVLGADDCVSSSWCMAVGDYPTAPALK
jgi:hypothetical protein